MMEVAEDPGEREPPVRADPALSDLSTSSSSSSAGQFVTAAWLEGEPKDLLRSPFKMMVNCV